MRQREVRGVEDQMHDGRYQEEAELLESHFKALLA